MLDWILRLFRRSTPESKPGCNDFVGYDYFSCSRCGRSHDEHPGEPSSVKSGRYE